MNGLREACHCGHDKATHYLDHASTPAERCSCLASCCECVRYVNEFEPKLAESSASKGARPNHASWCRCARCKDFAPPLAPPVADDPDDVDDIYPGTWP